MRATWARALVLLILAALAVAQVVTILSRAARAPSPPLLYTPPVATTPSPPPSSPSPEPPSPAATRVASTTPASPTSTPTPSPTPSAAPTPTAIRVTPAGASPRVIHVYPTSTPDGAGLVRAWVDETALRPKAFEAPAGAEFHLLLVNVGQAPHALVLDGNGRREKCGPTRPAQEALLALKLKAGSYRITVVGREGQPAFTGLLRAR